MDNKLLEARLLTRESTIGGSVGSSVFRCANKFQSIINSKEENINVAAVEGFMREILLYKLDIGKCAHIFNACDNEIQAYYELESEIKSKIEQTISGNKQLEIDLDHERQIRSHRETIETQAKQVNLLPTRTNLKRKIDATNGNIESCSEALKVVDSKISQRQQQFNDLLQAITDLQSKLQEEEEVNATSGGGDGQGDDEEEEEYRDDGGDGRDSNRQDAVAKQVHDDGEGEANGEEEGEMDNATNVAEGKDGLADGDAENTIDEAVEMDITEQVVASAEIVLEEL